MDFYHVSVLLEESVEALITDPAGTYVDCTLGGAGHGKRITEKLMPDGHYIGIDQDAAAIKTGRERLGSAACQVDIVENNFSRLHNVLDELQISLVDGILFDLGVSSYQLDTAERGFSYMQDAPLDMRMSVAQTFSAFEVVNTYSAERLTHIIKEYGEERWAKRIADFIVRERGIGKLETTGQLVEVIKKAIPAAARRDGPHPAKRTFQAIRIEVNNELGILEEAFKNAIDRLKPGGRLCIITFHSLEDRIAKQVMQAAAKGCICPPQLPICVCNHKPKIKVCGKPVLPSPAELESNPRSRSAKLRIAQRL